MFVFGALDIAKAGAPEGIRTPDPQIRSLVLYPAELPVRRARNLVSDGGECKAAHAARRVLPPGEIPWEG
jgi:hypothetical protein